MDRLIEYLHNSWKLNLVFWHKVLYYTNKGPIISVSHGSSLEILATKMVSYFYNQINNLIFMMEHLNRLHEKLCADQVWLLFTFHSDRQAACMTDHVCQIFRTSYINLALNILILAIHGPYNRHCFSQFLLLLCQIPSRFQFISL